MGFLSSLIGRAPTPSRFALDLLVQYAYLVEMIGMDMILEGVEATLLAADKDKARDIIAKASLHMRRALFRKKSTSKRHPEHAIYPYLLRASRSSGPTKSGRWT
jgi:carbamoylphosphate synthase large subunit